MGRPAVVPPAGRGRWVGCAPFRGAGGTVGRFLRKRRGHVRPARRSEPDLGEPGEVGMDREDSFLIGRWAARMGREGG